MSEFDQHIGAKDALQNAFRNCRSAFTAVAVFSFAVNLFILTVPLYMFSVFDKVLSSYSLATLGMLFAMALFALGIQGLIDVARSGVLIEIGNYIDRNLTSRLLHASLSHSIKRGNRRGANILQRFTVVKTFLTSNSIYATMDVPWIPLFMAALFLMNPIIGLISLLGAVILMVLAVLNDRASRAALMRAQKAMCRPTGGLRLRPEMPTSSRPSGMTPTIVRSWHAHTEEAIIHQCWRRAARR